MNFPGRHQMEPTANRGGTDSKSQSPLSDDSTQRQSPLSDDSTQRESPLSDDSTQPESPLSDDSTQRKSPLSDDSTQRESPLSDDSTQRESPLSDDSTQQQSTASQSWGQSLPISGGVLGAWQFPPNDVWRTPQLTVSADSTQGPSSGRNIWKEVESTGSCPWVEMGKSMELRLSVFYVRRIVVGSGLVETRTQLRSVFVPMVRVWIPESILLFGHGPLKETAKLQWICFESNSRLTRI
jgi:hypothetical protein